MFERELRDLAHVPRWSILRKTRTQSVAEHMYFVAIYAVEIAEMIDWPGDRYALLRSALAHDIPEVWTGDPPGPAKRAIWHEENAKLFEHVRMREYFPFHRAHYREFGEAKLILTAADRLEASLFLADEWNMGNKSVGSADDPSTPFGSNVARLRVSLLDLPCADDLKSSLMKHVIQALKESADGVSRIFVDPK